MKKLPGRKLVLPLSGLVVALVFLGGLWWWTRENELPQTVFFGALANNLAASGVTCRVEQDSQATTSRQTIALSLVGRLGAHATTSLQQNSSSVTTEELSTKDADYVRYTAITTGQKGVAGRPLDFGSVLNVWGKSSGSTTLYSQMIVGSSCVVPFGHLTDSRRQPLLNELHSRQPFKADFAAAKLVTYQGQRVRSYPVTVQPSAYITFLQHVAKQNNLHDLDNLQPSAFSRAAPAKLTFIITARTHRLVAIHYGGNVRSVSFTDYNKPPHITLPAKSIPAVELQQRLEAVK